MPITGVMSLDGPRPRVTLGIATYNRDTYLQRAVESCLQQDFPDLEVLVVLDGSANPAIDAVLAGLASNPRLRIVRHERNRGIAAAYNTFVSEGRGELIAMLGDDDESLPGRIRRQVEIFDRYPETGVVHGDGIVIDARGKQTGVWNSGEFTPAQLVQSFFRSHNHIVDPTRMVHRRVYEAVGGYDPRYPLANDFDFWLRATRQFRFRHCAGGPLVAIRRHGENTSDETTARARELDDVERALEAALEHYELRELIPELDWSVLDPADAERQALLRLADALEQRALPVPGLAAKLRRRAERLPVRSAPTRRRPAGKPQRLMMTAFGWNDSGGGTTVPRLAAKELARRGWEVTVFHAAVRPSPSRRPVRGARVGRGRGAPDRRPQPPPRLVRPRQPAARDRRSADHRRVRGRARPSRARRRPLPQPPQPRCRADRRGRGPRSARLLHDAQLLADLSARVPDEHDRRDLRRPGGRVSVRELRRLGRCRRPPATAG